MMRIGLAVGNVPVGVSVCDKGEKDGCNTDLYGHATCLLASSAQALKQPAGDDYLPRATRGISRDKISQG